MEPNHFRDKSKIKNGKRRNRPSKSMHYDLVKSQIAAIESVPVSISKARIQKSQKDYLQSKYWNTSKRKLDIFFSLMVVVFILSWMYPLLYILIKLESKGPLIFKQKRSGLKQEYFTCYKFRSMEINDYTDILPSFNKDPRITKIGGFIRKSSIDELPQFINVLKGDMTIVGPRPHMISDTDSFNKISSNFYMRHQVKPGITGLAQINNCRGQINSMLDLRNRLRYDLFYIKNASLLLDLKIIYRTVLFMLYGDVKAK